MRVGIAALTLAMTLAMMGCGRSARHATMRLGESRRIIAKMHAMPDVTIAAMFVMRTRLETLVAIVF